MNSAPALVDTAIATTKSIDRELRILAIVPSSFCFGLQNLTLEFFGHRSSWVRPFFLNTAWNDGEFPRRLDALGLPHAETWFGMFSRRLDPRNIKMTLHCLVKLPLGYWDFLRIYRRFRPDVIYLANHHEIILLWPLLLFFRQKVICHMHDPSPAIPFQKASFSVWRLAVRRFIFISQSVRDRTALLGRVQPEDPVVHNGVKVESLALPRLRKDRFVRQFGWPAESVIVGLTGQMTATKGHEDFVEAAFLAAKQCITLRFVIGGKALEPLYPRLLELIEAKGLRHRFGFPGWLESSKFFFEGIDVFVMASRHDEGFGLVVAEAMERAVPVVATRSGGAVEIVVDGVTGFLVEKQAPIELAARIDDLARDAEMRAAIGQAGRSRVVRDFELQAQVRRFEAVIAEVAGK